MRKKTILIVEDELMIAEDLLESLTELGYHVPCTVPSGPEALARTRELKPDLVLMDIMLKGPWDGIQTAHEIHRIHDCALIYLTAYTDQKMLQRAKITTPFGYILKPFREKELHAMVEISLHRHEAERKDRELQQLFHQTLTNTQDAILVIGPSGHIQFANPAANSLIGLVGPLPEQPIQTLWRWLDGNGVAVEDLLQPTLNRHLSLEREGHEPVSLVLTITPLQDTRQRTSGYVLNLFKAHHPPVAPVAAETPVAEAAASPAGALISLCASCKNVRTPHGGYISLEQYFRERFGVRFSHGICPGCFEMLYPDYLPETPLDLPEQKL
ncbi:MAG: response regulator [Candidatus Sericytochromatia bacterium]